MIEVRLVEVYNATHPKRIARLFRLQHGDEWKEVHHIFDSSCIYGATTAPSWVWADEEEDEESWEGYFIPRCWTAHASSPQFDTGTDNWAYWFQFDDDDQTEGVCLVGDVNAALRALGYEADRRGD